MTVDDKIDRRDYFNDFDLDAPDFAENYEEVLGELVAKCPVARSNVAGGYWVVSRYEDVRRCAQDWETFSSEGGFEPGRGGEDGGAKLYPVELDPPYQTRWRGALGPYFNPRAIKSRTESIREQITDLIDGFIEKGSCDFVDEFAAQLPGRVFFATFLGVPLSELPYIQEATDVAMRGPMDQRPQAWGQIAEFLDKYLKMREKEPPRNDFVDVILAGVLDKDGQPCSWEHKLFILIDLLAGGIGTTTYLLAGMAHHLATHPEDKARLAADPSLHRGAIEEFIRYYASIVALGRTATRDTEVAGQKITKGEFLMLSFAAACRDPEVFDHPHEVDIDRHIAVNPAFGSSGPHRCIGSHIARLEAAVALEEILRRLPDIAMASGEEPVYSNSTITRNMDKLPLVFTPGPREVKQ
ncbi:cytochrome P450 (plasmid) [Rhodococcus sp. ZPP]|uniref:cytochrome P450 n=1 Tax=Rhodococcus sp. ZPP TaxID=2749906 RepID=UPI001AD897E2|nr:cytochrome P450 [Rhodococcus sp. ZPP]QTJ70505.1 cytochrome P450 [Rhodococcus sp. ZPP]